MHNATHTLDISKPSYLSQGTASNNNDTSHSTSCDNIVIVENSLHDRNAPLSVIVPFSNQTSGNILPLSNKLKISNKSVKTMPKITVNTNNLQRIQKGKSQNIQKRNIVNDIDDDLGNILDIPIIFAKDDENLNNIGKTSLVTQTTLAKETQERCMPKLNNTTKVVLISNKQDKLQQTSNKFGTASTQAVVCSNMSAQNLNHLILQTRSQNSGISVRNRVGVPVDNRLTQPTVKYTKIILAKKNLQSSQRSEKNSQVIVTRTSEAIHAPKILTFEKDKHRYIQTSSVSEYPFTDNILEIEDAIKTNIIERKCTSATTVDMKSPADLHNDHCIFNESKDDEKRHESILEGSNHLKEPSILNDNMQI